jgi:uncharacterized membrane protein (DUF4010 family)
VALGELLPFVYALAIGLLIGAERERSHPGTRRLAGSRTFALAGLVGALAAFLGPWLVVAGLPVVGALMVVGYRRTSLTDPGTTTEVALVVTYLLGAMTIDHAPLAAALAIGCAVVLMAKAPIHAFARDIVTDTELEDALKFGVLAFVILPLLPDEDLGPYGALNPHRIWLIVVTLTGISWVGYVAVRALGARRGLLVTGLAGGFVSASATTATMARRARITGEVGTPVSAALLASLSTFIQLIGIVAVAAPSIVGHLWPACVTGAVVIAAIALVGARSHGGASGDAQVPDQEAGTASPGGIDRPFALRPALVLAAILTAALFVGRWAADTLGPDWVVVAAGAAGLADAHAGAIGPATLGDSGVITTAAALVGIATAVAANTITKLVIAVSAGGWRFAVRFAVGLVPGVAAFFAVLALTAARL